MKARIIPIFFDPGRDDDFDKQLDILKTLLSDQVDFLKPVALGDDMPDAEAVIFPQFLGEAYRRIKDFKKIDVPFLVVTGEFGTVLMWDWEIVSFLQTQGIETIAPSNFEQTILICKCLGLKRELENTKFLVYQDNPGEGFQGEIFKRFYWWEDSCTDLIKDKFGVTIEKKSYKEFNQRAQKISDADAETVWTKWKDKIPIHDLNDRSVLSAIKIYMQVKLDIAGDDSIRAVGMNCLNESRYSDTTPCLAWNMLYEETGLMWGCEGDIMSMMTKYLLHKSFGMPIMMTNIYPFLMGMAALKHERIPSFPEIVEEPDNHMLLAHCGYFGVVPQSFSTDWCLRPKVLAIVDDNSHAIDARMAAGKATMAKLDPTLSRIMLLEGDLKGYVQYKESDCLNGAIMKLKDGYKLLDNIYSHHQLLMTGHWKKEIGILGKVFNLIIEDV
jgi:hypothetical protein